MLPFYKVCLLNDLNMLRYRMADEVLISNLLVAAKILLANYWKSIGLPSKDEWLQKLDTFY